MKKNNGFSAIILVVIIALVLLGASAAAYYYYNSTNPFTQYTQNQNLYTPAPYTETNSSTPVSNSDDLQVIEAELNSTDEGNIDADFQQLDYDASSL